MSGSSKEVLENSVDHKYPWWDGNWLTYEDYKTHVELRADGCKEEDLPFLGPKLASNLVGRAFESLGDIDRPKLRKKDGWSYLLTYLENTRGRTKVDLLGDMFSEFFLRRDAFRKDSEEINDYETRYKNMVRRMEKAIKETNSEAQMPQEVYGWFLLNIYMKMSPSDTANVRGRIKSYKLKDVMDVLRAMWSGGGLASRDAELKAKKQTGGQTFTVEEVNSFDEPNDPSDDSHEEHEILDWLEEAVAAVAADPTDGEVLANFRDARKALDQARTSRGFYPVKMPGSGNYGRNKGKGKGKSDGGAQGQRTCFRCISQDMKLETVHRNHEAQVALALSDGAMKQNHLFQNRKFLVKGHTWKKGWSMKEVHIRRKWMTRRWHLSLWLPKRKRMTNK